MMWTALGVVAGFGLMLWAVIALAKNSGRAAAQLDMLQTQAQQTVQEQEQANALKDTINRLPIDAVRRRLQNLSGK